MNPIYQSARKLEALYLVVALALLALGVALLSMEDAEGGLVMVLKSNPTTAPTTLPSTQPSGPVTVTITQTFSSPTAGFPVHVSGLSTVLPSGKSPRDYSWTWSLDGQAMQGFIAAHVFNSPGTYQVTLTLRDDAGVESVGTASIVVAAFSGTSLYVSSSSGSDTNPGTLVAPVATLARAKVLLVSNQTVYLKAGDAFPVATTFSIGNKQNIVLRSYGTGTPPRVNKTTDAFGTVFSTDSKSKNIVVRDLSFDATAHAGEVEADSFPMICVSANGQNIAMIGCEILNVSYGCNSAANGLLVQNLSQPLAAGMRSYAVFGSGDNTVITGCNVTNSTRQHDLRGTFKNGLTIYGNTIQDMDRRTVDGEDIKNCAIRVMSGSNVYIANNLIKSSVWIGENRTSIATPDTAYKVDNCIIRDNVLDVAYVDFRHGCVNTRFTNNYLKNCGINVGCINSPVVGGTPTINGAHDIQIDRNTAISTASSGNFFTINSGQQTLPYNITLSRNVFHALSLTGTGNGFANLRYTDDLSPMLSVGGNVAYMPTQTSARFAVTKITNRDVIFWNAQPQVETDDRATSVTWVGSTGQVVNSQGQTVGCSLNR